MYFAFSPEGLLAFFLPLFINLVAIFRPTVEDGTEEHESKRLGNWENIARELLCAALLLIRNERKLYVAFVPALLFLVLYYVVWFRYYQNGREKKWLKESFCRIPYPLALFPVGYFLFASLALENWIALVLSVFFGILHITGTHIRYRKEQ